MVLLFVFLVLSGSFVNSQLIDVTSCEGRAAAVTACKTNNPVTGDWQPGNDFDYFKFYTLETAKLCATGFNDLLACVVGTVVDCLKGNQTNFQPKPEEYKAAVKKICDNKEDYDPSCLTDFTTCADEKKGSLGPETGSSLEDLRKHYCPVFEGIANCTKTADSLKNCQKEKTKMISQEIFSDLIPESCNSASNLTALTTLILSCLYLLTYF